MRKCICENRLTYGLSYTYITVADIDVYIHKCVHAYICSSLRVVIYNSHVYILINTYKPTYCKFKAYIHSHIHAHSLLKGLA